MLEMVVQFGFVSMFASVFPLAPLFALANNLLEMRSDAFKLLTAYRRPRPVRVAGIGTWLYALEVISVIAVVTNVALVFTFFTAIGAGAGDGKAQVVDYSLYWHCKIGLCTELGLVLWAVALEHVLLAGKEIFLAAIPPVPHWIKIALAFDSTCPPLSSTRLSQRSHVE